MPENTQKQIDEIIEYINNGILADYDTWPNDIKMPIGLESEGCIFIDTTKLDIQKAKASRARLLQEYTEEEKHKPQIEIAKGTYRRHGKKD